MLKINPNSFKSRYFLAGSGLLVVFVLISVIIFSQNGMAGRNLITATVDSTAAQNDQASPAESQAQLPAVTQSAAQQPDQEQIQTPAPAESLISPAAAAKTPGASTYQVTAKLADVLPLNPDIVGWIKIPGTVIDYPIVCGDDNSLYLDHDYQGNKSKAGAIMMDYRNLGEVDGRHSILYGHNMKNGTMFHNLRYYKNKAFALKNNLITVETLSGITQWKIFSCYVSDTKFYFIQTDFADDKAYGSFLKKIQDKSKFDFGIKVTSDQQILTLVTCTYEFNDARFVVHAVKID